jgi:hypothetical protein
MVLDENLIQFNAAIIADVLILLTLSSIALAEESK